MAAALLLTAACAEVAHQSTRSSSADGHQVVLPRATAREAAPRTAATLAGTLRFTTPEAALRRLTTAWNAGDVPTVHRLTAKEMRPALAHLHTFAANLRFSHCNGTSNGVYMCFFDHDLLDAAGKAVPASGAAGRSSFSAIPSKLTGWQLAHVSLCGT